MIRNGADGYILKSANLQELIHAIETVAKGSKYFGEKIQEIVYNKLSGKEKQDEIRHSPDTQVNLTRREIEILSLIAQEYTNPQIAEKLFISERTVETHRKNIFSKTKAKSIIGLSKYAIRHGLVNLE
jgi:DNA-binding NarL/FixJ family response regulator